MVELISYHGEMARNFIYRLSDGETESLFGACVGLAQIYAGSLSGCLFVIVWGMAVGRVGGVGDLLAACTVSFLFCHPPPFSLFLSVCRYRSSQRLRASVRRRRSRGITLRGDQGAPHPSVLRFHFLATCLKASCLEPPPSRKQGCGGNAEGAVRI